jgi:ParB family chromosome partitioning protein
MPRTRRARSDTAAEADASARALTRQAKQARTEVPTHSRTRLPVADILDRVGGDTRPLSAGHVEQLLDSIRIFGLIQPIVVDRQHHLLAGAHRLAALLTWRNRDPTSFEERFGEGVPVHVYDLDASSDPTQALAVEISENEKRRDYSRSEAIDLARRLLEQGYSHRSTPGAPRQGEQMLVPALSALIGRSEKTIRRYLRELDPAWGSSRGKLDTVQIRARTLNEVRTVLELPALPADDAQVLRSALAILERFQRPTATA